MGVQEEVYALLNPEDPRTEPEPEAAWNKLVVAARLAKGMGTSLYPEQPAEIVVAVNSMRSILASGLHTRNPGRYLAWEDLRFTIPQLCRNTWALLGAHNSTIEPLSGHLYPKNQRAFDYVLKRLSRSGLLIVDWDSYESDACGGKNDNGTTPCYVALSECEELVYRVYGLNVPDMLRHQQVLSAAGAVTRINSMSDSRKLYGSETFSAIRLYAEHFLPPYPHLSWRLSLAERMENLDVLLVRVVKAYLRETRRSKKKPVLPGGVLVPMLAYVYNEVPQGELVSGDARFSTGKLTELLDQQQEVAAAGTFTQLFRKLFGGWVW